MTGAQVTPESERPLAAGGSTSVGIDCYEPFHYTAMGHLHALQKCSDRVRYCGSLMKYSFSEASQKKSVILVDLDGKGSIQTETIPLNPRHDLAVLKGSFQELMTQPRTEYAEDYLRIILTDKTPVLDPKHLLETHYAHILQLGYEGLEVQPEALDTEKRKGLAQNDLFEAFFESIHQRPMNETERALLREVMDAVDQEGRNC